MRIGVLTGGGDCPGLNAAIRAITRASLNGGDHEILGFVDGWNGLLTGTVLPLTAATTRGILHRGGTIIGSARTDPRWFVSPPVDLADRVTELGFEAIIAIGGDGTLRVAQRLHELGVPIVGVPKTIDNDLAATELAFGFDTAVQIATDAIDRLHTTAESHRRLFLVEVMGRDAGWIALHSGLAGGADAILVPERAVQIQDVCDLVISRARAGRRFSVAVVAEGVRLDEEVIGSPHDIDPAAEHGGVVHQLAREIQRRTQIETRSVVLGHLQRGGTPTAFDRLLATRLGAAAVKATEAGQFGQMTALRGGKIVLVALSEAVAGPRRLTDEDLAVADAILCHPSEQEPALTSPAARPLGAVRVASGY